jgi:flagellar basal-body rod protein FlgB
MFDRGSIPALELMVRFSSVRHRVIAANLANSETAGYRAQDLPAGDFKAALLRALSGTAGETPAALFRPVPAADAGPLKPGGNNVDIETETARMVRNQGLHAFATALLAQQLTQLREAVSERILA